MQITYSSFLLWPHFSKTLCDSFKTQPKFSTFYAINSDKISFLKCWKWTWEVKNVQLSDYIWAYLKYVGALDVSRLVSVASSVEGHVPLCNPAVATLSLGESPNWTHVSSFFFSNMFIARNSCLWGKSSTYICKIRDDWIKLHYIRELCDVSNKG